LCSFPPRGGRSIVFGTILAEGASRDRAIL
jgi:hypothetical protein